MGYRLIIFWLINFSGLAIGALFTAKGVPSEWYQGLPKAPWTPPSWAFGVAWNTIMIAFGVYLAYLWPIAENKRLFVMAYVFQILLNTVWTPVFFYFHLPLLGMLILLVLAVLLVVVFVSQWNVLGLRSLWLMPYLLWLVVACSLNGYVCWKLLL